MQNEEIINNDYLNKIASSFEDSLRCILHKIDEYSYIPTEILNSKELYLLSKSNIDSGQKKFKKFLNPQNNSKLLDIGCFMNFISHKYYKWKSTYYGIDISEFVIKTVKDFADKKGLKYGFLLCAPAHKIPSDNDYFDYITCINVFEYFDLDYAQIVMNEIFRVLKPCGKVIIDIPNPEHKCFESILKVEKFFNRENKFIYGGVVFESLLKNRFTIANKDSSDVMIQYFLIKN